MAGRRAADPALTEMLRPEIAGLPVRSVDDHRLASPSNGLEAASSRMVCLIVFTSSVPNTSLAITGAATTSGVLLKINFLLEIGPSSSPFDRIAADEHRGTLEVPPNPKRRRSRSHARPTVMVCGSASC